MKIYYPNRLDEFTFEFQEDTWFMFWYGYQEDLSETIEGDLEIPWEETQGLSETQLKIKFDIMAKNKRNEILREIYGE